MNRKLLLLLCLSLLTFTPLFCSEEIKSTVEISHEKSYLSDLDQFIEKDISVSLADVDVTILGKLIKIYEDGIYVETLFNDKIFISSSSIAFIKIREGKKQGK